MAKISELTTLTAPITSSDLVMMIRPNSVGGYSSYKSRLNWFGELSSSSGGITASGMLSEWSFFLGGMMPSVFNGYGVTSAATASSGRSVVRVGAGDVTVPVRGGLTVWNNGYDANWGSGSSYSFAVLGTTRNPYGGFSELCSTVTSATQGTRQGSGSYLIFPTASAAVWLLNLSYSDQTPVVSTLSTAAVNSTEIDGANYYLQMAAYTSSAGTGSLFTIGKYGHPVETYGTSTGAGYRGIRMDQGNIYAPQAYQVRLGYMGIVNYSDGNYSVSQSGHFRLGHDYAGGGAYLSMASGSTGMGGMISTPNVTASVVLASNGGNILISTGFPGAILSARTIVYGPLSTTGSINSTGYINLPKGSDNGMGIPAGAELTTGSMAFNTASMELVVFTGDGAATFAGSAGWKVATLT